MSWTPPPEPLSWKIDPPIEHNGVRYGEIVLRAPTGADLLKATAINGASGIDQNHKLIESVSGVPYDVIKRLGYWRIKQMSDYFDEFMLAPSPDPLEEWRKKRVADAMAEAARTETTPAT